MTDHDTTTTDSSDEESVTTTQVGECDEHGFVTGDDVEFNFPQPARCGICGERLERCTVADEARVVA